MRLHTVLTAWVVALAFTTGALAGGFSDEPFSLRLSAALTRYSGYGDVAGVGGASAGSPWNSSVNPAAAAWTAPAPLCASPQLSAIHFDEGTRLTAGVASLTFGSEATGWFLPTVAKVWSNRAPTSLGLDFEFDLQQFQLQWGKRFTENFAAGVTGGMARSETRFTSAFGPVASSDDTAANLRLGGLYRVAPRWIAGLVIDYGRAWSDTDLYTPLGPYQTHDTTRQVLVRPGFSLEYADKSFLYVDYQYGRFGNDEGTLVVHRLFAGAEHRVFKWFYPRLGASYDNRRNLAGTAGIGLYPMPALSVDLAYQHDFFPELDPELGPSRAWTLSLSWSF